MSTNVRQMHNVHSMDSEKVCPIAIQAGINEDLEQRRRLLDFEGEQQRRWVANKTAQLYSFTPAELRHVNWPVNAELSRTNDPQLIRPDLLQQLNVGLAAALHNASQFTRTLGDTYNAAVEETYDIANKTYIAAVEETYDIANKTYNLADAVTSKAYDLASTVAHKTQDIAIKSQDLAATATHNAQDIASSVTHTTQDIASSVAHKTHDIVDNVSHKAVDSVHNAEIKSVKAAVVVVKSSSAVAALFIPKAQALMYSAENLAIDVANKVTDTASTLAHDAVVMAHDAKEKLEHVADDLVESTTRAYVKALEESERRRRTVSWDEQYAIINALAVSNLIKNLGFEFYRQSECEFGHNLKALEEFERMWRMLPENVLLARSNANKIALLVDGKFSPVLASLPPAYVATKVEVVEPVKFPKAAGAAF